MQNKKIIIEQQLGIPPDYQYKAINSKNFLQANWHKNKLTTLEYLLKLEPHQNLLDLGAGSGNVAFKFSHKVKNIVTVDYNEQALDFINKEKDKKHIKNIKTVHADIRELPQLNLGKFDYILLVDVLEHISLIDAKKFIKNIKRFLKKDGKVIIITPNYKSFWLFIEEILDHFSFVPKLDGEQHLAKYYPSNLKSLFLKENYKIKKVATFNLFSFLFPSSLIAGALCKFELTSPLSFGNLLLGIFEV